MIAASSALTLLIIGPSVEPSLRPATGPSAVEAPQADAPDVQPQPVHKAPASPPEPPAPLQQPTATLASTDSPPADTQPEAAAKPKPEFSPGVQVFLRGQGRVNPDFGAGSAPDTGTVLQRARVQLGARWGPLKAFAQVQDARTWGFEASTVSNEANTDLHQGFLEIGGETESQTTSGYLRAGRQEVVWGKQRMIGSLLWLPGARSFDAVRAVGKASIVELDMFVALLAPRRTVADDSVDPPQSESSSGAQLAAAKLALSIHEAVNVEGMSLAVFEDGRDGDVGFERRLVDFGGRVWGTPFAGLTYDVEAHGQTGRVRDQDHRAWAWAASLGYMHGEHRVKPGGHLGYAMASGHRCSGDTDVCANADSNDFYNFFPTNHIHYGIADQMNWSNMRDLEVAAKLGFDKLLTGVLAYHYLQLQEPTGRWTNAGGGLVGSGWDPANTGRGLGHEFDAFVTLKPWAPYLMVQPGYALFLPVDAGVRLAGNIPQHFAFVWLVGTFG
ncbi:MAG: alginate export family protein [Nannocystales bacterium]